MLDLENFRTGQHGLPFSCADELPDFCFSCVYLLYEEASVCFCEAPFYYYCAYSWPDKLTQVVPPCLEDAQVR